MLTWAGLHSPITPIHPPKGLAGGSLTACSSAGGTSHRFRLNYWNFACGGLNLLILPPRWPSPRESGSREMRFHKTTRHFSAFLFPCAVIKVEWSLNLRSATGWQGAPWWAPSAAPAADRIAHRGLLGGKKTGL